MENIGGFRLVRAADYGILYNPEPLAVMVQWDGGEREVFNNVTRAYVSESGSLTLMGVHGKAVGRVALINQTRTHKRKGKVVATFDKDGERYTALLECAKVYHP